MAQNRFYSLAAKCLFIIVTLLLLLPHCSKASELIYTIQTGSFARMAEANKQFDNIFRALQETEIQNLRVEKVGNYFSVRIGKFEKYPYAQKFLQRLYPLYHDATLLKAYIKDERIKRFSTDSLSPAEK